MDSGPYPVCEGEPDCSYYIRTGHCRFGATCRFNHPPNINLAIATAKMRGEYPERAGYPECQNESECAYYLRTRQCKFGNTCKFDHPQPNNMMVTFSGSSVYPSVQSPTQVLVSIHTQVELQIGPCLVLPLLLVHAGKLLQTMHKCFYLRV